MIPTDEEDRDLTGLPWKNIPPHLGTTGWTSADSTAYTVSMSSQPSEATYTSAAAVSQ